MGKNGGQLFFCHAMEMVESGHKSTSSLSNDQQRGLYDNLSTKSAARKLVS